VGNSQVYTHAGDSQVRYAGTHCLAVFSVNFRPVLNTIKYASTNSLMPFWFGRAGKGNIAKGIVKNWEKSKVSDIADEIVRIIPGQVPFLRELASTSLSGMLRNNLSFSESTPQRINDNLYNIIDTVRIKVGPGIPFIDKQFTVSINYSINVDVKAKKIVEARPDISSLKIDLL
jgi:hypothetical protein